MGGTVVNYFLQWVTTEVKFGGGGGGKDWVDKYIHAYVNIAGKNVYHTVIIYSIFQKHRSSFYVKVQCWECPKAYQHC